MTKSRHKAREVCLQALYWTESAGDPIQQTVHTMCIRSGLAKSASEFASALAKTVWANREALDQEIEPVLDNWSLKRVARIDRILLRMALAEMHHFKDIPVKVSIDEAIELAKRYSEAKASGFINGILDALAKKMA
ncbi:MAG: transcription antitermination factor NusB [Candidatus Latescibacteria bacterium]|jgi:transcription antitermination protein NusB|nr:transcription antitermination factor NusB [Candidatus Latescibacterota bacterium]